jgi:GNAT superfamily N-acetyltransferase
MALLTTCVCGERVEGADGDALFGALRTHSDAAHADLRLSDGVLRDLVAAKMRMTPWDGQRQRIEGEVETKALVPGRIDDFLGFFDRDAFMDNPIWASCYCMFHEFAGTPEEWETRTATENRADKRRIIESGGSQGYFAYAGGRAIGWCHAAPRASLPAIERSEDHGIEDDSRRVGSIVCFVVAAPYRGQGVARKLLDAACDGLRGQGLAIAEGYPAQTRGSDARAFHGPLEMYLAAGFRRHREGERLTIVRRPL